MNGQGTAQRTKKQINIFHIGTCIKPGKGKFVSLFDDSKIGKTTVQIYSTALLLTTSGAE